jgi:hypothetical protein
MMMMMIYVNSMILKLWRIRELYGQSVSSNYVVMTTYFVNIN